MRLTDVAATRRFFLACLAPAGVLLAAASSTSRLERGLFDAVNRSRRGKGLPALAWSEPMAAEARRHSTNMVRRGFFSHDDPRNGSPSERLTKAGIAWRACAENIYQESGYSDPVRSALDGWLDSPGHRRNLLGRQFTHTGVGLAVGPGGTHTFTQIFAAF